jgi:hypothetical protein
MFAAKQQQQADAKKDDAGKNIAARRKWQALSGRRKSSLQ